LLQRLGYNVKNGKSGGEDSKKIVVRYFAKTNPGRRFFFTQSELDLFASTLGLDTDFSDRHAGDPGKLVLAAAGHSDADAEAFRNLPFAPLAPNASIPSYPGQAIVLDSTDKKSVLLIQKRLRDLGFTEPDPSGGTRPLSTDGGFGQNTANAVELFQVRHSDLDGNPLDVDGKVGAQTWGALFGRAAVPTTSPAATAKSPLLAGALEFAAGEIGVREEPLGSNKGKRVVEYQASVGIPGGGEPWCAAFVYFCFQQAAAKLGVKNPVIKTASVLDHWNTARDQGIKRVLHDDAVQNPALVKPGMIFIISTGNGTGHTGLVESISGTKLVTIEGNTNDDGSREGIGVFRRSGRSIDSINRGFIDYGK
jgi:peptidoglycan hydrolase-like protein with peptidoglycan-binding domain